MRAEGPNSTIISTKCCCRIWLGLKRRHAAVRSGERGSIKLSAAASLQMLHILGRKGRGVYEHVRYIFGPVSGKGKTGRGGSFLPQGEERGDLFSLVAAKLPDISFSLRNNPPYFRFLIISSYMICDTTSTRTSETNNLLFIV